MKQIYKISIFFIIPVFLFSCTTQVIKEESNLQAIQAKKTLQKGTFGYDLQFLKNHDDIIVLSDVENKAQIIVSPRMQGRVMTSTAEGLEGKSYGWVNYELIASGKIAPHINVFGGEDRFWLGPEGGQYSIFFQNGDPFDLEHWQTPASIDTESFTVQEKTADYVYFTKEIQLQNYSGSQFDLTLNRKVKLLSVQEINQLLNIKPGNTIKMVGFESENQITNSGKNTWQKSTGLLSIWILGMFTPSPATTIVIPFKEGPDNLLGPPVNDAYFGKVPDDRLEVQNDVLFFKGDGQYRSKIGISPLRVKPIMGSYNAIDGVLTLVQFSLPDGAKDYVNSMWEMQAFPYSGDVINSYNDGPTSPGGKPLGPFYELESSSPAAALKPGESLTHIHRTFHLEGSKDELNELILATLGVSLQDIARALP